jgi:hypothetical protein
MQCCNGVRLSESLIQELIMKTTFGILLVTLTLASTVAQATPVSCDGHSAIVTIRTMPTQSIDAFTVAKHMARELESISSILLLADRPVPCTSTDSIDPSCAQMRVSVDAKYADGAELTGFDVASRLWSMRSRWPIARVLACVETE